MKTNNRSSIYGLVGMASSVIWLLALMVEYRYGLRPPGDGSLLYVVDQILFFIALAGYVILLLGFWQAKAAGDGIFGKISLGVFMLGLMSLLIASVVQLMTKNPDFFLFPIGGILQLLGGLLTGLAVVLNKRWGGWQRFAPLFQGLYYLIVLILPLVIFNQPPTQVRESVWQLTWFITSLALFTQAIPGQITIRKEAAA